MHHGFLDALSCIYGVFTLSYFLVQEIYLNNEKYGRKEYIASEEIVAHSDLSIYFILFCSI